VVGNGGIGFLLVLAKILVSGYDNDKTEKAQNRQCFYWQLCAFEFRPAAASWLVKLYTNNRA
jgi:hypothetical protein